MTAVIDLLRTAAAEGVTLRLAADGTLMLRGPTAAVERLRPTLRPHKPALLAALATPAEAERLAERARRELGWGDADVRDFLDVSFRDNPHWALIALAEVLELVQRERQRARNTEEPRQ